MTSALPRKADHVTKTTDALRAAAEQAGLNVISQSQKKLSPAARALHRAVLEAFLETGAPPSFNGLHDWATRLGLEPEPALRELAQADLVHLEDGSVVVAYPFAGVPTADRVRLDKGPWLYAMCAVDALGVPWMTGRDGVISSSDPQSGEPIRVLRTGRNWEWTPTSTVVLAGVAQSCSTAAEACCPHVAFYVSTVTEFPGASVTEFPRPTCNSFLLDGASSLLGSAR